MPPLPEARSRRETPPETSKRMTVARSLARTQCGRLCYHLEEPAPERKRKIEAFQLRPTARELAGFFAALPCGLAAGAIRTATPRKILPARRQAWCKKRSTWRRRTNA